MLRIDDDNEDIFRRAAENYPLKADPDWEPVLKKLQARAIAGNRQAGNKKNYRSLLLLLLLLPVAVIFIKYQLFLNVNSKNTGMINAFRILPGQQNQGKSIDLSHIDQLVSQPGITRKSSAVFASVQDDKILNRVSQQNKSTGSGTKLFNEKTASGYHGHPSFISAQRAKMNISTEQAAGDDHDNKLVTAENKLPVIVEASDKKIDVDVPAIDINKKAVEKELTPKIINRPEKNIAGVIKNKDKKDKEHAKRFYAGLVTGPDLSTVKLYAVKRTGFSAGLIAGYRLRNMLSIEAGILWDKKLYSSNGEYFNTKNMSLPQYAEIEYVSGKCNMLELPLHIIYTFCKNKKKGWFATAGISSYFMRKESYVFDIKRYGAEFPYAAEYKKHDNQFLAVVNLSAGYTHSVGKLGVLRIQPYVKLPVQKIGAGEFHLQSAGMLIGFTRDIF